jgi:hypothetical protein
MAAEVQARVVLDWRDPSHYERRPRPCRVCGHATHLRDDQGRPCDKACAEQEIAAEMVGAAAAYFRDERVPSPAQLARKGTR